MHLQAEHLFFECMLCFNDTWAYICGCVRRTRLIIFTYTYNLLYLQYTCSPRMFKGGSGFTTCSPRMSKGSSGFNWWCYNTPPPSELGVVHEALRPMHMTAGACDSLWRSGWGCQKRRGVGGVRGTSRWWLHMSGLEAIQ